MSFLAAAIRLIREGARELEGWQKPMEFLPFAAHLFAAGTQLLLNEGSARLMEPLQPRAAEDLESLRAHLAGLSESLGAPSLYQEIIEALITIESEFVRGKLEASLPPSTVLRPLTSPSYRGITGVVQHWLRPRSVLGSLREARLRDAPSHPPDPAPHPGIYLDRLAFYWDSDPQLPGVRTVPSNWRTRRLYKDWEDRDSPLKPFRIALCPLEGPFHPQFSIDSKGAYFHARTDGPIQGSDELESCLDSVLDAAAEAGVHLILLPELTIDTKARECLQRALRVRSRRPSSLYGVVAGSFHVWDSELPPDGAIEPSPINETLFLDHTGAPISTHCKKGRFRVPAAALKSLPALFPGGASDPHPEIFENIRYGTELKILDTSLGRLALLICADAIFADDRGYLPVIRRLRPDLLLVVSMTPETEPFESFAEEMSRYWIGSVFVNAHCLLEKAAAAMAQGGLPPPRANLAACDLALHQNAGCPPSRARWRFGQPEPEYFDFKPPKGKDKGWYSLSNFPGSSGISFLRSTDRTLGLVVDLGLHWKDLARKGK